MTFFKWLSKKKIQFIEVDAAMQLMSLRTSFLCNHLEIVNPSYILPLSRFGYMCPIHILWSNIFLAAVVSGFKQVPISSSFDTQKIKIVFVFLVA